MLSGKIVDNFMKKIHFLLLIFSLFLYNCSSLKKVVEPPKIKLADVQVGKMSLTNVELLILLNVINPNSINFDVKNLKYTLDINSKTVTTGTLKEKVLVKAKEETLVTLPLSLKYTDIFSSALLFLQEEGMPYKVQGSAEIGPFTIDFNDKGSLKSSDLN